MDWSAQLSPWKPPEQGGLSSWAMPGKAQGDAGPAIRARVAAAGIEILLIANVRRT